MNLIFIYGLPGTGKLTVANEISKLTTYKVFHNHLVVDLAASLFEFGSEPFRELREKLWLDIFKYAIDHNLPGLIFTFCFEKTVEDDFVKKVEEIVNSKGRVYFVEIICDKEVLNSRIKSESRKKFGKLTDPNKLDQWLEDGTYYSPNMNFAIIIDNTNLGPKDAAEEIIKKIGLT